MISDTNQSLILNLDDIKVAAAEKLPTIARGEIEWECPGEPARFVNEFWHRQNFMKQAPPTKSR